MASWAGGKDASVQEGRYAHGCMWEGGAYEGEKDTTTAQVCSEGTESHDEGSEGGGGTCGVCGA